MAEQPGRDDDALERSPTRPSGGSKTDEIKPDDKQDSSSTSTESSGTGAGKQAGSTPGRR